LTVKNGRLPGKTGASVSVLPRRLNPEGSNKSPAGILFPSPYFAANLMLMLLGRNQSFSFTQGLIVGQLSVVLLLIAFIRFFIFGDASSPDAAASLRASERRARTLAHKRSLLSLRSSNSTAAHNVKDGPTLHRKKSTVLRGSQPLTVGSILSKTYYNVDGHQPESVDWFNVLVAQTIAQFRSDAQHDDAILNSLTKALNGSSRPDFVDRIRVTELSLGDDFPIFSNCRIIPVDEDGLDLADGTALGSSVASGDGARLQARMDVDLSDVLTLALETKLLLNYPKKLSAVLPVALAVSVVRFSGTLSISFIPSNPSQSTPAMMTFNFLDDYRLDLSVRSLLGSRSKLQDVPKIAQFVEARLHRWFDERCVEPRFQEIALPSLWPRKRNTRGPDEGLDTVGTASFGRAKGREIRETIRDRDDTKIEAESEVRLRRRPKIDDESAMPGSLPSI
jgi:maintenance of mitochondrial morphology protein 1